MDASVASAALMTVEAGLSKRTTFGLSFSGAQSFFGYEPVN